MIFANAASIMREDPPRVNKWCCSLPVKLCLQTWVYTKIAASVLVIFTNTVSVFVPSMPRPIFTEPSTLPLLGVLAVLLIVDIGFQVSSIVGVHKKSYNTLRVFHYYEIFAITTDIILTPVLLYTTNTEHSDINLKKTLIILAVGCFYVFLDVCIIVKVKREIMKIHHKYQLSSTQD